MAYFEITKRRKLNIYETIVKSTLLYGTATWKMMRNIRQGWSRNGCDEKIFVYLKKREN